MRSVRWLSFVVRARHGSAGVLIVGSLCAPGQTRQESSLTSRLCLCTFTNWRKRATQVEFRVSARKGTSGEGGRGVRGRRTLRHRGPRTRSACGTLLPRDEHGGTRGRTWGRRSHTVGGEKVGLALFARGGGLSYARQRSHTDGKGGEWGSGRGGVCMSVRDGRRIPAEDGSWRKTDHGGDLTRSTAAEDRRSVMAEIAHVRPR